MKRYLLAAIMAYAVILSASHAPADEPAFSIASGELPHNRHIASYITDLYGSLGFKARVTYLPLQRSLVETNVGRHDAELARVVGMETRYPNLVRIPEPLYRVSFCAVVHKDFPAESLAWTDLSDLSHARQAGIQLFRQRTVGFAGSEVNNPNAIPIMVARRRVDVGVMICSDAFNAAAANLDVKVLDSPPLEEVVLYHYLHKRHEALIPVFKGALQKVNAAGGLDAFFRSGS